MGEAASYVRGAVLPRFAETFNQDVKVSEKKTFKRLFIDSRDATRTTAAFDFGINFRDLGLAAIENVVSAEIKVLAMPKVANESYAIIDIEELNDSNFDASNTPADMSFAVVHFDTSLLSAGDVKPIKDFYSQRTEFNPPLAKLDRLNIKVRRHDGSVISTANTGGITTFSMLLEIATHPRRG